MGTTNTRNKKVGRQGIGKRDWRSGAILSTKHPIGLKRAKKTDQVKILNEKLNTTQHYIVPVISFELYCFGSVVLVSSSLVIFGYIICFLFFY